MTFTYIRNENGEFVCQHCGEIKKRQSTMNMHYNAKHNGDLKHSCDHCPMKFSQKSMLDLHISARHPESLEKKTVEKFDCPCKGCEFSALTKANRRIHFARIHLKDLTESLKETNDQLHCIACQKDFKSPTAFYYHVWGCIKPETTHTFYKEWKELCS